MKLATVILVTALLAGCATGENITPLENITPSAEEWVKVAEDKGQGLTYYAIPDSIKKTDNINIVTMWVLMDYKTLQQLSFIPILTEMYMSMIGNWEYNCKTGQSRAVSRGYYVQNMGRCQACNPVGHKGPDVRWRTELPSTPKESVLKYACKD